MDISLNPGLSNLHPTEVKYLLQIYLPREIIFIGGKTREYGFIKIVPCKISTYMHTQHASLIFWPHT